MGRFIRVVVVVLALATVGLTPAFAAPAARTDVIVVLRDDAGAGSAVTVSMGRQYDARISHVYERVLHGFAASVPDGRLASLRRDPRVAVVEVDGAVQATEQAVPSGVQRIGAPAAHGLGAVGARDEVGVPVGILDSGISDHEDLNVARELGRDCTGTGTTTDDNGHGTHVAGTVGAVDNDRGVLGVAPAVRVVPVKVLNAKGSGQWSWIICGLDHAAVTGLPVVNMSLSGSGSWDGQPCSRTRSALYTAICGAIDAGTTVVVAAGNNAADASTRIPAAYPEVITVSALEDHDGVANPVPGCATTCEDALASFSNYGDIVDVVAPGVSIRSTTFTSATSYGSKSGTSMAAPHVAGVAALIIAAHGPISPQAVRDHLLATGRCPGGGVATDGACTGGLSWPRDPDGITEPVVDAERAATIAPGTAAGPDPVGPTPNTAPTAAFTASCTGLTCAFTDASTDTDGSIASWSWSFGDGGSSTIGNASHTYATAAAFTVTLTVTDDDGATDTTSDTVTVSAPSTDLVLTATGGKTRGVRHADLRWTPATIGGQVVVLRDGRVLTTTADDGAYRDAIGGKGGGSATYQVCVAGTTTCSNEATVTW